MDVNQLRYFLKVLDHGSVNAAAQDLGVAQPTVSQAIKGLERELGLELFFRIGRGMVPTSAGHAMAGSARQTLRDVASAVSSVQDAEGHVRGRLDLAVLPPVSGDAVARLVTIFHEAFPKVVVEISDLGDEASAVAMIRDGRCDVVLTHLPLAGTPGSEQEQGPGRVETVEIGTQEYWLAIPEELADTVPEGTLAWEETPDVPLVVVPRGGVHARQISEMITRSSQGRLVSVVIQQREARLAFVLAGLGATFIERGLAERASELGVVVRALEPPLLQSYGLVHDPETVSPLGRAFVEVATTRG